MSVVIISGTIKTIIAENVSLKVARTIKQEFIETSTSFAIIRIKVN